MDFRWVQARDSFHRHFGSLYQIMERLVRLVFFLPTTTCMDVFQAKLVAAATGSTLTALTSPYFFIYFVMKFDIPPVTPFDLVKTRLQTQPPRPRPLFPRPPNNTCCQPLNAASCVRNMSSFAIRSLPTEVVCVWEGGMFKTERVNGFFDALRHVWRAEGARGLWKGVGTTL